MPGNCSGNGLFANATGVMAVAYCGDTQLADVMSLPLGF